MIRWDLETDQFDLGQWLNCTVKTERSGLSEDGKLFAYYALDYRRKSQIEGGPHVSISRPPYFSALALWWAGGMHTGGAQWVGPREIGFCEDVVGNPDKGSLPSELVVSSLGSPSMSWWHEASTKVSNDRAFQNGVPFRILSLGCYDLDGSSLDAQWADVDHRGRLLLARKGKIYVRDANGERELIDLNPLTFRPLEPPQWATEWP